MAFNRPTLDQLIERVKTDIKGGLSITTVLRRSFLGVISRAMAGLAHLLFGFLEFIAKQVFPDTAVDEFLKRWAAIWGITQIAATFAEFDITITGNDTGTIPINTIYHRTDGTQYRLDAEVTIPVSGTITGKLIAVDSGDSSNVLVGDTLSLISPIINVDSDALVLTIIIDAEDTEDNELLRERLIARIQRPPNGGSAEDYIVFAREVAGVTRAWVLPLFLGAGTVGVTFVEDGEDPIIPSPAKVAEVDANVQVKAPVTASVTVFAPVAAPMAINIKLRPNTVEVQDAVEAELLDLIRRDAQIAGAYKDPVTNYDGKLLLSKINSAISLSVGVEDHEIETINGLAPDNVTPAAAELITLGVITWQALA